MHGPAFSRTERRTRRRSTRTGALENWLARNRVSGHGPQRSTRRSWRLRRPRWRLVHRTRSGLGHNHSRWRRLWLGRRTRRCRPGHGSLRRCGSESCRRLRRCCHGRRSRTMPCGRLSSGFWRRWDHRRHRGRGRLRQWGQRSTRRSRSRSREHNPRRNRRRRAGPRPDRNPCRRRSRCGGGLRFQRLMCSGRTGRSGGRRLLLADDRLQHIARLGDMGKIDLGLDGVGIGAAGPRRPA